MTSLVYHIVQHDGGWAYKVGGSFSETFPSHDAAHQAAERAAREQRVAGATVGISWEDEKGVWHEELDDGADRPGDFGRGLTKDWAGAQKPHPP